ncbi:MAG: 2-oxoacid:acceptor oxidoreductase family protein [Candidatus Brocadiia bacterium]
MPDKMVEIRWHARGGQGAKTAATLVAAVALEEGKFSQGFPDYGPEREGAPIRGYTRISDTPVQVHSAIYTPDIVVVLDASLLDSVDVSEGLKSDGIILINSPSEPAVLRKKLGLKSGKVYTVDATRIATEEIGRPIPNTPMMGALMKAMPILKLETILHDIEKKFKSKGEQVVQGNFRAIRRAFEEVKEA